MNLSYRNQKNAEAVSRYWGKPLDRPEWYKIEASANDQAEILVYDVIGWPYNDAGDLVRYVNSLGDKDILVRLNTPGGDVFDGMAIFNSLANHKGKVTIRIEALAASVGSVLAMAGKEIQAYSNTMMMIHDPWTYMAGNQYELREMADLLEKISGQMLDVYAGRSKVGKREMKEIMKAETWYTAKEAKEKGFIDTILETGKAAKAQFDLTMYTNAPDGICSIEGRDLTEREIERALRDAGASRSFAKAIVAERFKPLRDAELKAEAESLIQKIYNGGK
ncbi:MAG TPA: Clp protease ClpP [Bacillota bacterium]|nr:Clp protease ClpP [Bacillota bacterium]